LRAHPGFQIGHERRAEFLANRLAPFGALTVDGPLDLEQASIRRTVSNAKGEMNALSLATRVSAKSAITKNGRRAWTQHAASRIGPALRPGS
jgi:hypothetical protein